MSIINVILTGAAGRMGQAAVRAISQVEDMVLTAATTVHSGLGEDVGSYAGLKPLGVPLTDHIPDKAWFPNTVLVDLTHADSAYHHALDSMSHQVPVVIGSTGLTQEQLKELETRSNATQCGVLVAPNFAIGAIVMMKLAQQAAQYFEWVEIIEMHHEKKKDAPSGTAIKTAQILGDKFQSKTQPEAARGDFHNGIPIHSIRLPGLVAHQAVIFGMEGQTLTIRHDTINRESFMPGMLLAIRQVQSLTGYFYGLENIL